MFKAQPADAPTPADHLPQRTDESRHDRINPIKKLSGADDGVGRHSLAAPFNERNRGSDPRLLCL